MRIGYKKLKNVALTPSRKYLGKCVAKGSRIGIAIACLQDDEIQGHILIKLGHLLNVEVVKLCGDRT